jgi:hypothetical protein
MRLGFASKRRTVLCVVAITIAGAAKQASAVTFFDDLAATNGGAQTASDTNWLAGTFTTGGSTYTSLTATLLVAQTAFGSAKLDLYSSVGAAPGALIDTFTSPSVFTSSLANADFTLSNLSLTSNTNYWIVLHAPFGSYDWGWTSDAARMNGWATSTTAGTSWSTFTAQPLQYRITSGLASIGDYNGNGTVDAADYIVWRQTLGSTSDLRADGSSVGASAGVIDQADYDFWKSNFGRQSGSGSAAGIAVPEPTSMILLLVAAGMLAAFTWPPLFRRTNPWPQHHQI